MKALARFAMRGYSQAALVVSAFALLSMVLPLFGLISSAAVALVTLRSGAREGAAVTGLATLACGVIAALALGTPLVAVGLLLLLWLPLWGLAALLRHARSLALALQGAALVGVALVLLVRVFVADPASVWIALLAPVQELLAQDAQIGPEAAEKLVGEVSAWMTGSFVAALVLQWLGSLFIARWWQALLYNPGGFGQEFRSLRLPRWLGIAGLVLLVVIGFRSGPGPVSDLLILVSVLWMLQGLAVIHALRLERGLSGGWIIGLYVLMVLFMPHAELLVACIGLVDIWVDIRAKSAGKRSVPPQG